MQINIIYNHLNIIITVMISLGNDVVIGELTFRPVQHVRWCNCELSKVINGVLVLYSDNSRLFMNSTETRNISCMITILCSSSRNLYAFYTVNRRSFRSKNQLRYYFQPFYQPIYSLENRLTC